MLKRASAVKQKLLLKAVNAYLDYVEDVSISMNVHLGNGDYKQTVKSFGYSLVLIWLGTAAADRIAGHLSDREEDDV